MNEYIEKNKIINLLEHNDKVYHYADRDKENIVHGTVQTLCRVIIDAKAADVQPVKWISVKDRLPDESCECLGVVDGEVTEVSYRSKQKEFICVWSMCDADGFKPLSDDAVTHWMPLPEPPKNGDVE
jgi:hypothetical protein